MPLPRPLRRRVWRWIDRRHGNTAGPTVLRHRRVYILPTRLGLVFAVMLVLMWIGAVNYSNNLAFLLVFLLAGIGLVAMYHVFRNLVGLWIVPGSADPVFVGERAHFTLLLENRRRRARFAIEAVGDDAVDVPAGGTAQLRISRRAQRRCRLTAGRIKLATRYPVGLYRAWSWARPGSECLVYPAPETGRPPPPESDDGRRRGERGSGEDDFAGLRPYRPGDPVRRIAWKATHAREPQIKLFAAEAPDRLWLRWEATGELPLEARLSRLCRWILEADVAGHVYGLALPRQRIEPATGAAHRHRCLSALALFGEPPP